MASTSYTLCINWSWNYAVSLLFFLCSLWPLQTFGAYHFGEFELKSVLISQRYSSDSTGYYSSAGEVTFSWWCSTKNVWIAETVGNFPSDMIHYVNKFGQANLAVVYRCDLGLIPIPVVFDTLNRSICFKPVNLKRLLPTLALPVAPVLVSDGRRREVGTMSTE